MSTANDESGHTGVADLGSLSDTASPTPVIVNEAAVAADPSIPVAALEHLIDYVHTFTGFNWWASIALTTFIFRGALVSTDITYLRDGPLLNDSDRKFIEKLDGEKVTDKAVDPKILQYMDRILEEIKWKAYSYSPRITFAIIFYISNMAEKVPSFKTGGLYWFLDLSTPDSSLIFPLLTALTVWICYLHKMIRGNQDNNINSELMVDASLLAVISVPLTSLSPEAAFLYFIPTLLFSAIMRGADG